MLKVHRNKLLGVIHEMQLSPSQFTVRNQELSFVIQLTGAPMFFAIEQAPASYDKFAFRYVIHKPGFPLSAWEDCSANYLSRIPGLRLCNCGIDVVLSRLERWLALDVRPYLDEQQAPDLWTEAQAYSSLFSPNLSDESQRPFEPDEQEYFREAVVKFRILLIDEFHPSSEQLDQIERRLDYLTKAVERLNLFDWQGLLLNTTISIGITLSLDTERGRQLYELAVHTFNNVTKLLH